MLTEVVRVAESVGQRRAVLASQLRWPASRVDDLLGQGDPRPSLRLAPEPGTG